MTAIPRLMVLAIALVLLHAAPALAVPVNTTPPQLNGEAREGQTLEVNAGTWEATGTLTFAYVWERCELTCTQQLPTGDSYPLTDDDIGATIQVHVTASDDTGAADPITLGPTATVQPALLVNVALPSISGDAVVGEELTASPGTWEGTEPFDFEYQWLRCTTPTSCVDIGAPDSSTYTVQQPDFGLTIRVRVTASDNFGQSESATSDPPVGPVESIPFNTVAPSISTDPPGGEFRVGTRLQAAPGTWGGSPTEPFRYEWLRCNSSGGSCASLGPASETQNTYDLTAGDVNSTIRVRVTAENGHGASATPSPPTPLIQKALPGVVNDPTVTGDPTVGQVLTAQTQQSDWSGTGPFTFSYQWQRCSPACTAIAGATSQTYQLTEADFVDENTFVRVEVTASNQPFGGTFTASSDPVGPIRSRPINTVPPSIQGQPRNGQQLTAGNGQWKGTSQPIPITFTQRWSRCDAPDSGCVEVATGPTYTPGNLDFGKVIQLQVMATNGVGQATQTVHSATVESAPFNTAPPTITDPDGAPLRDRDELEADVGTWSGSGGQASFSFSYQWESCDTAPPNCSPIPGATEATFQLRPEDVGKSVRVRVSGANQFGSFPPVESATTGIVEGLPVSNVAAPLIEGTAMDGEELVATDGRWEGSILGFGFQWKRCDASGSGCTAIPGATGRRYRLTPFDVGSRLMVTVTADVAGGPDQTDDSPVSAVVAPRPPSNVLRPSISGPARVGRVLTASDGIWIGTGISLSRNWLRCGANGCTDTGATGATYAVTGSDVGAVIVLRVTATGAGSATADSAPTATVSGNGAPRASFVYHPRRPTTSDTIALTSTAGDPDGAIVSQSWDTDNDGRFDDGNGVEAEVRFRRAGRHDVSLRVVDNEGAANTVTRTINVRRADRLISPFPVVRIVGGGTPRGARIRTLVVRAPRGAKVTVRCKGRRCPARRQAKAVRSGRARFKRFERSLVAGTVLEVFVTQRDRIGKYTRFQIRRGKAPRRTDRCLLPGSRRPRACPGG